MTLHSLAAALQDTAAGRFVAVSAWAFPTLEALHVLCLTTVFGTVALVDLRLMGLAFRDRRITALSAEVLPFTWAAFAGALLTGSLLLSSQATVYLANPAFRWKMLMLALAGLNMMVFHLVTWRRVQAWDGRRDPPFAVRIAGLVSMALWIGVVVFGRWIGFTLQ